MHLLTELTQLCKVRDDLSILINRKIDAVVQDLADDQKDNETFWKNMINWVGMVTAIQIRRKKFGGDLKAHYDWFKALESKGKVNHETLA